MQLQTGQTKKYGSLISTLYGFLNVLARDEIPVEFVAECTAPRFASTVGRTTKQSPPFRLIEACHQLRMLLERPIEGGNNRTQETIPVVR